LTTGHALDCGSISSKSPAPISSHLRFFLSALQVQGADHSQKIEKTEEGGRIAACGFGEIGENCDFTGLRMGLAEFEVALANP
jgi:hypothetical protein